MTQNAKIRFHEEYDAIIAALSSMDGEANTVEGSLKKERLCESAFDLFRSPLAADVDDKAALIIGLADVLQKVDPS